MTRHTAKRLLDVAGAFIALALFAVPMAIIALLIRVRLGSPILYRATRPGLRAWPFVLLKFRTMTDAVDATGKLLPDKSRITPLGRFLRRTSLDELPQLINVLKGEMSLVGPRPLKMEYLKLYTAMQARRHDVKPGITGLAQIHGRNALSWDERFEWDVRYVDEASCVGDLAILVKTVVTMVTGGAVGCDGDLDVPSFTGSRTTQAANPWASGTLSDRHKAAPISPPRVYLSSPHVGEDERRLLLEAFDSNWIAPIGPQLDAFEREFRERVSGYHAVATSSGTAALHLALDLLGIGRNDDVLVSTLTFVATANVIVYRGAHPVFIDCSRDTWTIDPNLVCEELDARARRGTLPKALITVDLYGQCADYDPIREACARYGVPIVEDAAEALGASYKGQPAGTFGKIAAFSFNGNKIITTSCGGMLISPDADVIERARFLMTQAREPVPHYEHVAVGYNYRMSNLLAAIGRAQLRRLDLRVQQRRANRAFYVTALAGTPGVSFMPEAGYGRPNGWLTCVTVDPEQFGATREDVRLELDRHNIEARAVWKPLHLQPVFRGCRAVGGAVATQLFENGLCLPSGSNLVDEDRRRTVAAVLSTRRYATPVRRLA